MNSREKKSEQLAYERQSAAIDYAFEWLCENQKPYDERYRPGQSGFGGGGAIYPEMETSLKGFVVYYTPNIDIKLRNAVEKEMPRITNCIMEWLPSTPTIEPMYLLLCAGGGGGWAVNAYKPKENGIISLDVPGLLSVYAHELAHTLGGPANAKGEKAGESPFGNQGEAHAGWFQGKIDALYDSTLLSQSVKRCGNYFTTESFRELDLKRYTQERSYADSCGNGAFWNKIWVIWQKMDDAYGAAWYPRWKWVQYSRWAQEPQRNLTWEETVEDISIAVGDDLFPFFLALHTSLDRSSCSPLLFEGDTLNLPKATWDYFSAPGAVKTEPIGDWKKKK